MKPRYLVLGTVVILCIGAVLDVGFSIAVWKIENITDGPWWVGFLIFGFCYLCALPGLLLPYWYFAWRRGSPASRGLLASSLAAGLYPCALVLLTRVGGLVTGQGSLPWDKALESFPGWAALIAMTLGPGTAISYLAVKCDAMLAERRAK